MGCKLSSQPQKHTLKCFSGEGIRRLGLEELKYGENKNRWYVAPIFDLCLGDMDNLKCNP